MPAVSPGVLRSLPVLFLLLSFCDRPRNPFGPETVFVSVISGVNVRETPGAAGKIVDLLPLNEPLIVLERKQEVVTVGGRTGHWLRVKFGEGDSAREGWVFDSGLDSDPVSRYFRVQAAAGVPLRGKPDLREKSSVIVPYQAVGRIETASRRIESVEGRRGFWFRTTYKDVTGWIFSGSVVISSHRKELEKEQPVDIGERGLEESDLPLRKVLEGARSVEVIETDDYRVHAAMFALRENEVCDRPDSLVVFERKRDGQLFVTEGASARLLKQDYPLPGGFLVSMKACSCCCGAETIRAIFPDRAGPRSILFVRENLEAHCSYDRLTGEQATLRSENRVDPESGDLFLFWQRPLCRLPAGMDEAEAARVRFSIQSVQEFRHDFFARIRFSEGRLRIDRYQDRRIPPSLREAWERSDAI